MTQGYMTVADLATYRVTEDPASPAPVRGYIMACAEFYERRFVVPSHQFLPPLLQFYGLELHYLTTSGILHMAAFENLCEAYMSIEPHFDLWNYFFCAQLQLGSDAEAAVPSSVDIFVRSGPRVDPYFCLPISDHPVGWWKVWFLSRNHANVPLPVFMGSCPVPQPKWEYGVA
jgi:hypothetical protein